MQSNLFGGPCDVLPVSRFAETASFQAVNPASVANFVGAYVRETAGSTALVRFWRGIAADLTAGTSKLLGSARLAANAESRFAGVPDGGALAADEGVFVEILSGTVDVTVYYVRG